MTGPNTLWHATAAPLAEFPALNGLAEADLVVIGGGFAGLSTALHAARDGISVILLEGERIAWGASGRNAGFVVPNFAKVNPEDVRAQLGEERGARLLGMAASSADLVFELIRRHSIDAGALQGGWIEPSHSEAALARAQARVRQWQALARPVTMLSASEVREMTGVDGWLGGWMDRSGGTLNPVTFARGLAAVAAEAGVGLFERSPVTSLQPDGSGWQARTPQGRVTARRAVLATNAHAGSLWPGLARTFFPLKVFQIATDPLPARIRARFLANGRCVSDSRRNLFTFRFDPDGRLITGGMNILGFGAEQRVPRRIMDRMVGMLRLDAAPRLAYAWTGLASITPNFLPRVIELAPGLMAGFSCNGRGIAMSVAAGREYARWAAGTPADALAVPRFAARIIPFHMLARLAPHALLPVSMLRDRRERNAGLAP